MAADQHDATADFNEALKAAFANGKYEDLADFYTEDCTLLPPRGRALEGRGAVSAFWRGVKNRFSGMAFTTTGLKDLGEAAKRETGTYVATAAQGAAGQAEGKYVFVWQLVDGEWRIETSIWNRSAAPGQGQGQGQAQGQGQGPRAGAGAGPQRRPGAGGQGGGYRQGAGGYRQGGGYRQNAGGYRQGGGYGQGGQGGGRPSFQGGQGGIGGGGRRRRGGGQGGGGQGGGQGGGSLYEQSPGLYSDLKE